MHATLAVYISGRGDKKFVHNFVELFVLKILHFENRGDSRIMG
jgi:hypothetical protein